jgi:hypothetical protein
VSAQPLLAAAIARAGAWLLEPVDEIAAGQPAASEDSPAAARRPVVAVFGLGADCGATVVSRGLGAELAARDPGGACAVHSDSGSGALPLGLPAAVRLARTISTLAGARAQASGRLCLVSCPDIPRLAEAARDLAPLVVDAGHSAIGGSPAALADHVVIVATPRVEPALASVMRDSLARVGPEPLVVLNRAREPAGYGDRADLVLPESRLGAQLALAGREPRGVLGRALAEVADRCEVPPG